MQQRPRQDRVPPLRGERGSALALCHGRGARPASRKAEAADALRIAGV